MKIHGILAIIGIVAIITVSGCATSPTGNVIGDQSSSANQPICRDVQVSYETQEQYLKTEYYMESVPYTDTQCDAKPLTYSITDFKIVSSTCNNQVEECHKSYPIIGCVDKTVYCVDRTVTCSLKVNNLDTERGAWYVNFNFFKSGSNTIEATASSSSFLYPQTSDTLYGNGRITTKELIDTTYTCNYLVTTEPTKQVCRDVTKYKDVQRERQVTAYRPVTQYKTEQQCT